MSTTHLKGGAVSTSGNLPSAGETLKPFTLVETDLSEISLDSFNGRRLILNIFPSVDTGICAASVRRFNEDAAGLANTTVLCVSHDLPMALGRFCAAEGIENVTAASAFRSSFGEDYGVVLQDSPLKGLLARAVVVADENGKIVYSQLVDEISTEPDYEAALAALG